MKNIIQLRVDSLEELLDSYKEQANKTTCSTLCSGCAFNKHGCKASDNYTNEEILKFLVDHPDRWQASCEEKE